MNRSFYIFFGCLTMFLIVTSSFFMIHCADVSPQEEWVPDLVSFDEMKYKQMYRVWDRDGQQEFEVTVASTEPDLIEKVNPENFSIQILPLEDPEDLDRDRSGAAVVIDGKEFEHDYTISPVQPLQSPPPLFFKVHAVNDDEPPRFMVQFHNVPAVHMSVVVNAGHYKSIVLRRSGSGSSSVKFYHHHGDWNLHVLYQGSFTRCTYAYDCYAGHSIPSWWTSQGDESVEFRADCYGRCP